MPNEGGRLLAEAIARQGLTYLDVEAKLDLRPGGGFIGRLIDGMRKPGRTHASKMLVHFGIPLDAWDRPPRATKRTGTEG